MRLEQLETEYTEKHCFKKNASKSFVSIFYEILSYITITKVSSRLIMLYTTRFTVANIYTFASSEHLIAMLIVLKQSYARRLNFTS